MTRGVSPAAGPGALRSRLRDTDRRPTHVPGARQDRRSRTRSRAVPARVRPAARSGLAGYRGRRRQFLRSRYPAQAPGRPVLAPRLAACCKIVMDAAMSYMLILMLYPPQSSGQVTARRQALRAAAITAETGSQPSWCHTILPVAELSTYHGWSWTPYPSASWPAVSRATG
jgi:hypothetical protein